MAETRTPHPEAIRRLLLQVPNRRKVFEAIVAVPGTHARRLSRDLDMALGVVEHHVRHLERHGLVFAHKAGRRRTLYPHGQVDPADAGLLHILRKATWSRLLRLLAEGEHGASGLARRLGEPARSVAYHLRRLRELGVLDAVQVGREAVYLLREPQRVRSILAQVDGRAEEPHLAFVGLVERATAAWGPAAPRPAPPVQTILTAPASRSAD